MAHRLKFNYPILKKSMIKPIILTLAILLSVSVSFAQERLVEVNTSIKEVTLYLSGASISRTANVQIQQGTSRIVIKGLSPKLDSRSIQVGMGTAVDILSVSDNSATNIDPRKMPILNFLTDSIEAVKFELAMERNNSSILMHEKNLLLANMKVAGDKGVVVPELEDALALYRKELPVIMRKHLVSSMREKELLVHLDTLQSRYRVFKQNNEKHTREIILTVNASNATNVGLDLQYYVADAGWTPKYDVRSINVSDPIQLAYKAEMRQNTGEDWNGIQLTLSTNNPMYTPALPQLFTNFVNLSGWYNQNRSQTPNQTYTWSMGDEKKQSTNNFNQSSQNTNAVITDISFKLPFAVRLNSDNQNLVTEIKRDDLPVSYKYFSVPKAEPTSFLKAQITGWEDVNLLNGEANLYLEGTFLGKTNINPDQIDDTLSLFMGKDRRVVVKRTKMKENSGKNFFGNKITQSVVWEIEVRNTKKEAISIELQDQIPVSKNDKIEVIKDNLGGAELNEETGLLTWNKTLQPNETLVITFGFSIKYPKSTKFSSPIQQKLREYRNENYF